MSNDDDYDPRKPEYIIPATEEQMTHTSSELLRKQIAQLEDLVERRQAESYPKPYQHYEQVIAEMRYEADQRACRRRSSHFRMRSDPAKQPDQAVNDGPRILTHARIRSSPAPASSCDIVPPDDEPPHANRVHGRRPVHSPGEQLAARNATYTTLLGPSVRPAVCLLQKPAQNPSKGQHHAVARGPQPSKPTSPSELSVTKSAVAMLQNCLRALIGNCLPVHKMHALRNGQDEEARPGHSQAPAISPLSAPGLLQIQRVQAGTTSPLTNGEDQVVSILLSVHTNVEAEVSCRASGKPTCQLNGLGQAPAATLNVTTDKVQLEREVCTLEGEVILQQQHQPRHCVQLNRERTHSSAATST